MFFHRMSVPRSQAIAALLLVTLFGLLSVPGSARADTFCVSTTGELTNALVLAANLSGNHSVRMRTGVYVMNGAVTYTNNIGGNLSVSGGWNNGCTLRGNDPFTTVVNGNGMPGWTFRAQTDQIDITIELLRFVDFPAIVFWDGFPCSGQQKRYRVARTVLDEYNVNFNTARLYFLNECHRVEVENTLIIGGPRGVWVLGRGVPVRFVHNTIIGTGQHGIDVARVSTGSLFEVELYNNIVYGHGMEDIHISDGNVNAISNTWQEIAVIGAGVLNPGSFGNSTLNPQLASNGRPVVPGSPAINSGYLSIPGGIPNLDIEGNDRLVGSKPDRGAFETAISDSTVLSVTDPNDNGPGTLRAAIVSANASPGPKLIQFNIPGACPQSIFLQSPLPLLETNALMTIDGYSQSGSNSNTLEHGNNATICIQLRKSGSIPSLAYALRVPATSTTTLRLQGIGFGGVGEALQLAGGNNHLVQGNRFGDTLVGNDVAVKIFSGSSNTTVGGRASYAYRNTIADSSVAGVWVIGSSSVEISNNYIGTNADGTLAAPNATGISVAGAVGTHITANVISANLGSGVVLNGAATDRTVITSNRIGLKRITNLRIDALGNGASGILVTNGAHDSKIGGSLRDSQNDIETNGGAGVAIVSGQRNTITNNRISRNDGLGIDLASTGVLPNDDDSVILPADFANRGVNFPVLTTARGGHTGGTVTGTLSSTAGTYRVELFSNTACDGSGYGEGTVQVGAAEVKVPVGPGQQTMEFSAPVLSTSIALSGFISATATDFNGNTSEFAACIPYVFSELIFRDSYE